VAKIFHHVTCLVGMPQIRDSFPQAKSALLFWGDEMVENRIGTEHGVGLYVHICQHAVGLYVHGIS